MMLNEIEGTRKALLQSTGFGSLNLISKWNSIPGEFVKWVSENFEPDQSQLRLSNYEALPILLEDVQRVYCLPNEGKPVKPLECTCKNSSIVSLRKELGLRADVPNIDRVSERDLVDVISNVQSDEAWCKAVLLYVLGCLLCPDHIEGVSLKYANIVKDLTTVSQYQWLNYILDHIRGGTKGYKYPKSDLHFFMIHYLERLGPNSPLSRGSCTPPTLKNWDTNKEIKNLEAVHKLCGFGRAITSGTVFRPIKNPSIPMSLIPFDPKECPASKAPLYWKFSEYHIEELRECINIFKERGEEENYVNRRDVQSVDAFDESNDETAEGDDADSYGDNVSTPDVPHTSDVGSQLIIYEGPVAATDVFDPCDSNRGVKPREVPVKTHVNVDPSLPSFNLLSQTPPNVGRNVGRAADFYNPGEEKQEEAPVNKHVIADHSLPSFNLLSQTPPQFKRKLADDFDHEVITPSTEIKHNMEFVESHMTLVYGDEENIKLQGDTIEAIPLMTVKLEDDDSKKNVSSPEKYIRKRKRISKPSKYVQSPYDNHVARTAALVKEKNLVTYIWSPDQPYEQAMYQYQLDGRFNLSRKELWTLQVGEWVDSLVIDSWANILNLDQGGKMKRLVLTARGSIASLAEVSRENRVDRRDQNMAAKAFTEKHCIFDHYMMEMNITTLQYILIPAIACKHFVTYVLNLKMGRYEYLCSHDGFTRRNKSGTFSEFEVLGDRLMNEARSFVAERYKLINKCCPYKWDKFVWYEPKMPRQPDGESCGVFTMMFLKEWNGNEQELESFRTWDKYGIKERKLAIIGNRIELCCGIMNVPPLQLTAENYPERGKPFLRTTE